jgi:hypothetical protein
MLCALKTFTPNMIYCHKSYVFTSDLFHTCRMRLSSLQIALASLLPFPFPFLSPRLSFSVPVIDRDPGCALNSYTIGVLLAIQNSVSAVSGWVSVFTATWFCEGRARATQCHLAAGRLHSMENKICTWYDILLVMFLNSTPAFVTEA